MTLRIFLGRVFEEFFQFSKVLFNMGGNVYAVNGKCLQLTK